MSCGLPKLPGYNYYDPTITKYHLSSKCNFKNGYRLVQNDGRGIGNRPLDIDSVGYIDLDSTVRYNPRLAYGRAKSRPTTKFIPNHVIYANKCLTFKAYYKQSLPQSPNEHFMIHFVNIHYFLEDDTITVIEPKIPNSGFMEGRIIRRRRIEKPGTHEYWHWRDLNTNIAIDLQGIIFYTIDCDNFTKEFMRSQGIDINPIQKASASSDDSKNEVPETKTNYRLFQKSTPQVTSTKLKYLHRDDVLTFKCLWENQDPEENSEPREFILFYYLEDDTVSIKEVYRRNDGRDPFPKMLSKVRLPKSEQKFYHPIYHDREEIQEYYTPEDFIVGQTIDIFGRNFLILDCNYSTRHFYKTILNITQPEPVNLERRAGIIRNPFAKERYALQHSVAKMTTVYPKDELKLILNANRYLKYSAEMVSAHPEDRGRKFILSYSLADDTIKIIELKRPNSGMNEGTFLRRERIQKPNSNTDNPEYYSIVDLRIGSLIYVHKHVFRITGADIEVYNYMLENKNRIPPDVFGNIKSYMLERRFIKNDEKIDDLTKKDDEIITCFREKLEHDRKQVEGIEESRYPNKYYDPDAPCPECRYPIVIDGKFMPAKCDHVKGSSSKDNQEENLKSTIENVHITDNELIERHNRIECPVESCLAEHPYDERRNKKVTFVE